MRLKKHGGTLDFPKDKWTINDGLEIGEIYTIKEISQRGNVIVNKYYLSPDHFELVKPNQMNDKNLLPFSLEKAKEGYKIVTRSDIEVTEWHAFEKVDVKNKLFAIVGGNIECYATDGRYTSDGETQWDLFLLPRTTTVYRNVYEKQSDFATMQHKTLELALTNANATWNPLAVISITTTENNPKPKVQIVHEY